MAGLPDAPDPGARLTSRGRAPALGRLLARHPLGALQALALGLVLVVVFQNVEPTSIDLLFWSLPELPKLVVMAVSMLVGGVAWEMLRRRIFGRRARRGA